MLNYSLPIEPDFERTFDRDGNQLDTNDSITIGHVFEIPNSKFEIHKYIMKYYKILKF